MPLVLKRDHYTSLGIFGELLNNGDRVCFTLEHSYLNEDGDYEPKIPNGTYLCVKGIHELEKGSPFETFEITGVPNHSGLLFHCGNFNSDTEGCVLVGDALSSLADPTMLIDSRQAFNRFMGLKTGVNEFTIVIE